MSTTAIFQEFSIYSIESHGVYYIFRDSSAAFIRGRRLYEDGVYLKFNLFLANNGMITYYFNFEKQKYVFSAFLKSHFLFCSQIHNLHVNTIAIHNVNKALMSDMLSWHQNWYIKKKIVSGLLNISNNDRSNDHCAPFDSIIRTNTASCCGIYSPADFINISALEVRRLFEGGVISKAAFNRINTIFSFRISEMKQNYRYYFVQVLWK